MSKLSVGIQVVIFDEHLIVRDGQEPDLFELGWTSQKRRLDFWKDKKFDHGLYCVCLIEKIMELRISFLDAFLDFQLKQLEVPLAWLEQLETLLNVNVALLLDVGAAKSVHFLFGLIDQRKKRLLPEEEKQVVPNNSIAGFDIQVVKEHCKGLSTYREVEAYLLRMKFDYLQVYGLDVKSEGISFLQQIELELEYLEELKRLQPEEANINQFVPLIWAGKVNLLADFFYQCMQLEISDGENLILSSQKEVIDFLRFCFRTKEGKEFSASTLKTYLTPSRMDKRPKKGSWVDLQELYDRYLKEESKG